MFGREQEIRESPLNKKDQHLFRPFICLASKSGTSHLFAIADDVPADNHMQLINDLITLEVISLTADRLAKMLHPEKSESLNLTEQQSGVLLRRFKFLEELATLHSIVRSMHVFR